MYKLFETDNFFREPEETVMNEDFQICSIECAMLL